MIEKRIIRFKNNVEKMGMDVDYRFNNKEDLEIAISKIINGKRYFRRYHINHNEFSRLYYAEYKLDNRLKSLYLNFCSDLFDL